MANMIHIDLDDVESHLVDPPMVDLLLKDIRTSAWDVTFIPERSVSSREKERVSLLGEETLGQRVQVQIDRLTRLLKHPVVKIVHSGGGDFTLFFADGAARSLSDDQGDGQLTMDVYIALQDIAMTAQIAFLEQHPQQAKSA